MISEDIKDMDDTILGSWLSSDVCVSIIELDSQSQYSTRKTRTGMYFPFGEYLLSRGGSLQQFGRVELADTGREQIQEQNQSGK